MYPYYSNSINVSLVLTIKTRLLFVYIYIYLCNELIEDAVSPRKLIFGM